MHSDKTMPLFDHELVRTHTHTSTGACIPATGQVCDLRQPSCPAWSGALSLLANHLCARSEEFDVSLRMEWGQHFIWGRSIDRLLNQRPVLASMVDFADASDPHSEQVCLERVGVLGVFTHFADASEQVCLKCPHTLLTRASGCA